MRAADPNAQFVGVSLVRQLVPQGTQVGTRHPGGTGPTVTVTRVGGVLPTPIHERAMLTIACYADSEAEAEELCGVVRGGLHFGDWRGLRIGGHMVRGWREAAGPARYADPDRPRQVRFQFSGELTVSLLTNE